MGGIGSGGQNRKDPEEHRRRGTYQPSRHKDPLGQVVALPLRSQIPTAPASLKADGKRMWRQLWTHMTGLVEGRDNALVERVCESRDEEVAAAKDWMNSSVGGLTSGIPHRDPQLARALAELRKGMRQELALLGMSARDRKAMTAPEKPVSSLDQIKAKVVQLQRPG